MILRGEDFWTGGGGGAYSGVAWRAMRDPGHTERQEAVDAPSPSFSHRQHCLTGLLSMSLVSGRLSGLEHRSISLQAVKRDWGVVGVGEKGL